MNPTLNHITVSAWNARMDKADYLKSQAEWAYSLSFDTLSPAAEAKCERLWAQYIDQLQWLRMVEPAYIKWYLYQCEQERKFLDRKMQKLLDMGRDIHGLVKRYNLLVRLLQDMESSDG